MNEEFENLIKNTKPQVPADLREKVLRNAARAWEETSVEHQLGHCATHEPSLELRFTTLNAAKSIWTRRTPWITPRRWALAAAATLTFAICGSWYDGHQNAALQAAIGPETDQKSVTKTADKFPFEALGLDEDTTFLAGVRHQPSKQSNSQAPNYISLREEIRSF